MSDIGVKIPDNLLYTKELGPYVINEIYKQNVSGLTEVKNPNTGFNYTPEEAVKAADTYRSDALKMYNSLL
jgi:hypothetical protein